MKEVLQRSIANEIVLLSFRFIIPAIFLVIGRGYTGCIAATFGQNGNTLYLYSDDHFADPNAVKY